MRYQTYNEIPNEAALGLCWKRAGAARRKWEDEGAAALTAEDIHDITLVGDPADARKIHEQAQKERAQAEQAHRKQAKTAQTVTHAELRSFVKQIFETFGEILTPGIDARNAKAMWRNGRLDELEQRVAAVDGRTAKAVHRHFTSEDARAWREADEAATPPVRLKARHRGTWNATGHYTSNDAVIHGGRLWIAKGSFAVGEPGHTAYWVEARGREE